MAEQNKERVIAILRQVMDLKADDDIVQPGKVGLYDTSGNEVVNVSGRTDFVYVRLRGQDSEIVEAYNSKVGLHFDLPVIVQKDPRNPRYWSVVGFDAAKYQGWGFNYLPHHGDQHSFSGGDTAGRDIVFVFKRQLSQPLLCRPQTTADMTVYIEADYFYWDGEFKYWPGGSSPDLTSYKPGSGIKWVLVYLAGSTNTIGLLGGVEFSSSVSDAVKIANIPEVDMAFGIPLSAVLLFSGTSTVSWDEIHDVRILINSGASSSVPVAHPLDPDDGYHSGTLPAVFVSVTDAGSFYTGGDVEAALQELGIYHNSGALAVSISDAGGFYTSDEVEGALQELGPIVRYPSGTVVQEDDAQVAAGVAILNFEGGGGKVTDEGSAKVTVDISSGGAAVSHLHRLTRWNPGSGSLQLDLPDAAEYLDAVAVDGLVEDPAGYSLSGDGLQIDFISPLGTGTVAVAQYVVRTA